jgi:hypothetical protein
LGHTVLLADETTDRALLESILAAGPESEAPTILDVQDDQADDATLALLAAAEQALASHG